MRRRAAITLLTFALGVVAPAAGPAQAGATTGQDPAGLGTSTLEVTALSVELPDLGDIGVIVTRGQASLDAEGRGGPLAAAEVAGLRARLLDGTSLTFPNPPMRAETRDGRSHDSRGDASFSLPTAPSAGVKAGGIASGALLPAQVESWMKPSSGGASATSQIPSIDVASGLTRVRDAGPGAHDTWTGAAETGARAQALTIRSATLIETGPLLDRLGIDLADVPPAALVSAARALGLDSKVDAVGFGPGTVPVPGSDLADLVSLLRDTPFLAVSDVRGSVQAVASVAADGEPLTSSSTSGAIGAVSVGRNMLGGFDAAATAEDWNALETAAAEQMDRFLGSFGPEYEGLARLRVMPVLVEDTHLDGQFAVARSEIRLLDVTVDLPDTAPASPLGGIDDPLSEVPDVTGGGDAPLLTLGRAGVGDAIRVSVGHMAASARHIRPGVEPRCTSVCGTGGSTLDREWSGDAGFVAPAPDHTGSLPHTGGGLATIMLVAPALMGASRMLHRLDRAVRPDGGAPTRGDHIR